MGLRNAISSTWPNAVIRGCYFHFKQCLWRNFDRLGLTSEYHVIGSDICRSFQKVGALPFLPLDMEDFVRYFEHTWIGQAALFPPSSWNHHDASRALLPRSSNMAGGWHNGAATLRYGLF